MTGFSLMFPREMAMHAYSQDLRERVLRALGSGERPADIARRYQSSCAVTSDQQVATEF
jgi:hypothetical protein